MTFFANTPNTEIIHNKLIVSHTYVNVHDGTARAKGTCGGYFQTLSLSGPEPTHLFNDQKAQLTVVPSSSQFYGFYSELVRRGEFSAGWDESVSDSGHLSVFSAQGLHRFVTVVAPWKNIRITKEAKQKEQSSTPRRNTVSALVFDAPFGPPKMSIKSAGASFAWAGYKI